MQPLRDSIRERGHLADGEEAALGRAHAGEVDTASDAWSMAKDTAPSFLPCAHGPGCDHCLEH